MPTGSKYATGDRAWGLCQKCGLRFLLRTLVFDGYYPNLRVCVGCYDSRQPQEFLVDVTDPTALWKPSPEWGPENPQLSAAVFANEVIASWTECIPRGGSRVAAYLLYRSISTDGVTFTASVQIAKLPVVYYTDLADLVENGDPKFDNEGIELEFLTFADTVPQGANYARYQVFAKLTSGRLANSNIVTVPIVSIGDRGSIASAADFSFASLAAILPPSGNTVESIQSAGDFISASFTSVDPFFGAVVLLLHMDGTNGSTAFPDNSSIGNVFTASSPAAVSTANPEFGTGALALGAATNAGNITCPTSNGAFDMGAGDFTYEGWLFIPAAPVASEYILGDGFGNGGTGQVAIIYDRVSGGLLGSVNIAGVEQSAVSPAVIFNAWNAFAFVKSGLTLTMYLNGVGGTPHAVGSGALNAPDTVFTIGAKVGFGNHPANCQVDEVRITRGIARYTSNYTPAGPFPNS